MLYSTQNVVVTRESIPCRRSHVFDPLNPTNSSGSCKLKRKCQPTQKVRDTIQQVHAMAAELNSSKVNGKQFSFQEKVDRILEMSLLCDGPHSEMIPHCFAASVNPNIITH